MDNLDRLINIFDEWSDSMVNKHGHLVDTAGELLEKGLDKAAGAGFKAVEKVRELKEKHDEKVRKDS